MFFIIQQETIGRDPVQNAIIMDEKSKKRIDVYIPETHVVIEQKSMGILLDKPQQGHNGKTPYEQAKEYDNLLCKSPEQGKTSECPETAENDRCEDR